MNDKIEYIIKKITEFEHPKRKALSLRYPKLKTPIIASKRIYRNILFFYHNPTHRIKRSKEFFPSIIARHSSMLIRKLGDSNPILQHKKITNLKLAAEKLDGIIIYPGKTFSFWKVVGQPTSKKGYVESMLLSDGKVIEGIGGGLCQMSNLLFWLFLHTPVEIIERAHHSRDSFPDSGRVLPFGSGATVYYNLIDLQIKNISSQPLQFKIWLTDTLLKGYIVAPHSEKRKFHVEERHHCFVEKAGKYYRYNELWRDERINGEVIQQEMLFRNFAPIMYKVDSEYTSERNIEVIHI